MPQPSRINRHRIDRDPGFSRGPSGGRSLRSSRPSALTVQFSADCPDSAPDAAGGDASPMGRTSVRRCAAAANGKCAAHFTWSYSNSDVIWLGSGFANGPTLPDGPSDKHSGAAADSALKRSRTRYEVFAGADPSRSTSCTLRIEQAMPT
jgi:hypothetical protein